MVNVKKIMSKHIEHVKPDATLQHVAQRMRDRDIGCLLVGEEENVLGCVTDRDIVVRGAADNPDLSRATAEQVMSKPALTISEDAPMTEAAEVMRRERVRRLVAVDDKQVPRGIVSIGDIAAANRGSEEETEAQRALEGICAECA